jgi:hypothetical protein
VGKCHDFQNQDRQHNGISQAKRSFVLLIDRREGGGVEVTSVLPDWASNGFHDFSLAKTGPTFSGFFHDETEKLKFMPCPHNW